jgi:hypothetical protein
MLMIGTQSSVGMEEEGDGNGLTFKQRLTLAGRQRRDRPIPRTALLDPSASPWQALCVSGCDQALITLTGSDHESFSELETLFTPLFENHSPYSFDGSIRLLDRNRNAGGRLRKIDARGCLAVSLAWT